MTEVDRRTAYSTPDDDLPPLPDDPRVPTLADADPTVSKELGGAAPAVGSGAAKPKQAAAARPA